MICPRCGNELGQEEVFCGQCGTPNTPQIPSPNSANASLPNRFLPTHTTNMPFASSQQNLLGPATQNTNLPPRFEGSGMATPSFPNQFSPEGPIGPNQQTGFYHDATEALSVLPSRIDHAYPTAYPPQQGFSEMPPSGAYPNPTQFGAPRQQYQTGNFTGSGYTQPRFTPVSGFDNGMRVRPTPPPTAQKSQSNAVILTVSICLVVALISLVGIGTIFFVKGQGNAPQNNQQGAVSTATPIPTATPSPTPTPSPTAIPSPTPVPTQPPDTGFLACGPVCVSYGFTTEYPANWQPGAVTGSSGIQFTNPNQPDQYAAFKAAGPTTDPADALVTSDLQTVVAPKPNYTAPATTSTTTITGETWIMAIAYYQPDTQKERVQVYATVHQGQAYIIELQAADDQFDEVNAQFFINMLSRFQFLPSSQNSQGTP